MKRSTCRDCQATDGVFCDQNLRLLSCFLVTEDRVNIAKKTMPKEDVAGLTTRLELANEQYPCLVRASFKNKKISTVVRINPTVSTGS